VGRGTKVLGDIEPGEKLNILGPLGNTFTHPPDLQEAILVAGGLGIAPFPLLCRELLERKVKITIFYGAGTAEQFCCLDFFETQGADLHLTTDDGSRGERGFVTDSLETYLKKQESLKGRELFVCGPTPMLSQTRSLVLSLGIRAQVSVENKMACGFGACMGCPVERTESSGYKKYALACKDGPVFYMDEIEFDD
jgi:dihydroorotate dehydrogenase electron transfer subunit